MKTHYIFVVVKKLFYKLFTVFFIIIKIFILKGIEKMKFNNINTIIWDCYIIHKVFFLLF